MKKKEFQVFFGKTRSEKKKYLIDKSKKINVPKNITKKLHQSYKFKEVLNKFLKEYINKIKEKNFSKDKNDLILEKITTFKEDYINNTLPKKIKETPTNLYQMSGATDFAKINLILRSLSTKMGSLWENIADCSNISIGAEKEFDIKINGIDIIFLKDNKLHYSQIKTLEGTLTGSQVPRSIEELSMHENSYFVSAFETGTSWTFNSETIKRIKGKEFWSLIDLDYNFILKEVKKMIKEIEDSYYELKS